MLLDRLPLSSYCLTSQLQVVGPISAWRKTLSGGLEDDVYCFFVFFSDQPFVVFRRKRQIHVFVRLFCLRPHHLTLIFFLSSPSSPVLNLVGYPKVGWSSPVLTTP